MPVEPIPDSVGRFVPSSIPSVPYLEAILLLRGAPAVLRDGKGTAQRLYFRPQAARGELDQLERLATSCPLPIRVKEAVFRYRPASPELDVMLDLP